MERQDDQLQPVFVSFKFVMLDGGVCVKSYFAASLVPPFISDRVVNTS